MPDFDLWLAGDTLAVPEQYTERSIANGVTIADNPTSIAFYNTENAYQTTQIMRVEYDNTAKPLVGENGISNIRTLTLFGYRGHPTVADTVVKEGWRFWMGADEYLCLDPIYSGWDVQVTAQCYG